MATEELYFTIGYLLIAMCLVIPPTEFVSAGLTIQNMLSGFLGSEQMNFIHHHIKRTSATALFHSLLPLGYYLGLGLVNKSINHWMPWNQSLPWKLYVTMSIILPLCTTALVLYWAHNKWKNHPIAKTLQHHAPSGSNWHSVASSINIEFRRIDKFTTGLPGRRLIVTDSWLMKTTTYFVNVAHQSDLHLQLVGTDEHQLSHESPTGAQYLNIIVNTTNQFVKPFSIRLNAAEYSDLRDKLQSPVVNARNIMIQQSLSDRFLEAFRQQVASNDTYRKPPDMELEMCIGCMQTPANIKLVKLCDNLNDGDCVQCFCRPMWCLLCMGKWFSSRQDQTQPQAWLASKSPCPTCRARFCMLDVCAIV